jgi:hypothetical protein
MSGDIRVHNRAQSMRFVDCICLTLHGAGRVFLHDADGPLGANILDVRNSLHQLTPNIQLPEVQVLLRQPLCVFLADQPRRQL